jgi:hypothetical protein
MNPATPGRASRPETAGLPGHKAVGITLAPGPGRLTALLIVGVPFLIFVVIALTTTSSGGSPYGGGNPYGLPAQAPLPATAGTTPGTGTAAYSPSPAYPSTGVTPAGTDAATTLPASPAAAGSAPPATVSGPAATVQEAYNAINGGDYQKAYSLGLAQPGQSYADFAAGYQNTTAVEVTIVSVRGGTVTVDLTAAQNNGTAQTYTGTYTVSGGRITSANIQQTG